jgi:hypothetical protein
MTVALEDIGLSLFTFYVKFKVHKGGPITSSTTIFEQQAKDKSLKAKKVWKVLC